LISLQFEKDRDKNLSLGSLGRRRSRREFGGQFVMELWLWKIPAMEENVNIRRRKKKNVCVCAPRDLNVFFGRVLQARRKSQSICSRFQTISMAYKTTATAILCSSSSCRRGLLQPRSASKAWRE